MIIIGKNRTAPDYLTAVTIAWLSKSNASLLLNSQYYLQKNEVSKIVNLCMRCRTKLYVCYNQEVMNGQLILEPHKLTIHSQNVCLSN